jgi:mRNA interferase MazF
MGHRCLLPSARHSSMLLDVRLRRSFAPKLKPSLPMKKIVQKPRRCCAIWRLCVRGEVHRLKAPPGARGHQQAGARFAVVVQSDDLPLSTLLVAPTSTSARQASFRPEIEVNGQLTRVLAEQTTAVDPSRLGPSVGYLSHDEIRRVDAALRLVLEL